MRPFLPLLFCVVPAAAASSGYPAYIGDAFPYQVNAMTTDSAGDVYLTGARTIVADPTTNFTLTDVFVAKLDASGNLIQTFVPSRDGSDQGRGIAVDSSGNIWVAGMTTSPDFPLHNALQSSPARFGAATGFLTKLAPDGTILFSTYLGGSSGSSAMNAVAVDADGNAYVTGFTFAADYPRTPDLPAGTVSLGLPAVAAAFFAKISATGDKILYAGGVGATGHACGCCSSCFLSTLMTSGVSVAVDAAGNAYIAGNANGTGLPTTSGALRTTGIGAFVMKVNPSGSSLMYLTMLGSGNYAPDGFAGPANTVTGIAADSAGDAYITGYTSDPKFPATPGSFQPVYSIPALQVEMTPFKLQPPDAFAAKLNPSGSAMIWATYLGGAKQDQGNAIAVDPSGRVWVSGTTSSPDFPVSAGSSNGGEFVVEFNSTGSALSFGSRFPAGTVAAALALDSKGLLYAAGSTGIVTSITASQPDAPRLFGIANAAGGALSGRFAPGEIVSIYGQKLGVAAPLQGSFNSAGFLPDSLGGVQVTVGGIPAPLLYVSDSQINAVVPVEAAVGSRTPVQVTAGNLLLIFDAQVDRAVPGIFLNFDGSAAAVNQDGSINSAANPAHGGTIVSIWATGTGGFYGADGQKAAAALDYCDCEVQGARVTYAGASPGLVNGATQINFLPPASTTPGGFHVFLSVDGETVGNTFVYVAP